MKSVNTFGDDALLMPVLFLDIFKTSHLDVFKVLARSREIRRPIADVIKSRHELAAAGVEDVDQMIDLYKLLAELSVSAKNKGLIDSLQEIVARTGFIGFLLSKPRALELIAAYDGLLSHTVELVERHKDVRLANYLDLLEKMAAHNVSVRAKGFAASPGRVNLMTAHKSKGLEFDYVYCMNLNEGKWGGRRNTAYFLPIGVEKAENLESDVADERRLLYVALTRARKEVVVTYATHNVSGRETLPSQFIGEIEASLLHMAKEKHESSALLPEQKELGENLLPDIKSREYLTAAFLDHGFSVSALNNYLTCPWRFFFLNLIRIPRAEERFQLYGTAVHETLKLFFDAYKNEKSLSKKEFLDFFEKFLNRKALSDTDYELFLEKGKESLGGYFDAYKDTWPKNILNEFNVSGAHIVLQPNEAIEIPGRSASTEPINILIRGQLDKVEIMSDGSVNVVDYKTGNPKSRADIEGDTKSSDGNYKRQLVFYKMLLETFDPSRFSMQTGEIDFVEPNKQGKYKREKFIVTDEEVAELKAVVTRSAEEILTLSFWNKKCDDPECESCAMRDLLGIAKVGE
jgi:DNA helicase-2/ATP-dependent DNA helicase PcrA